MSRLRDLGNGRNKNGIFFCPSLHDLKKHIVSFHLLLTMEDRVSDFLGKRAQRFWKEERELVQETIDSTRDHLQVLEKCPHHLTVKKGMIPFFLLDHICFLPFTFLLTTWFKYNHCLPPNTHTHLQALGGANGPEARSCQRQSTVGHAETSRKEQLSIYWGCQASEGHTWECWQSLFTTS